MNVYGKITLLVGNAYAIFFSYLPIISLDYALIRVCSCFFEGFPVELPLVLAPLVVVVAIQACNSGPCPGCCIP